MIVLYPIKKGRTLVVWALGTDKRCELEVFLRKLQTRRRSACERVVALLDHCARYGLPRNPEKCRYLREVRGFELKTRDGIRVMAFWDSDKMVICSHAFFKQRKSTPKRELERLRRSRKKYLDAKACGSLRRRQDNDTSQDWRGKSPQG